jgi:hypothetical protein
MDNYLNPCLAKGDACVPEGDKIETTAGNVILTRDLDLCHVTIELEHLFSSYEVAVAVAKIDTEMLSRSLSHSRRRPVHVRWIGVRREIEGPS